MVPGMTNTSLSDFSRDMPNLPAIPLMRMLFLEMTVNFNSPPLDELSPLEHVQLERSLPRKGAGDLPSVVLEVELERRRLATVRMPESGSRDSYP